MKSLLRVFIVTGLLSIIALQVIYILATPEQRYNYLVWLKLKPAPPEAPAPEPQRLPAVESPTNFSKLLQSRLQEIEPEIVCAPPTRSIDDVDKGKVYRWVDSEGQVHFGDRQKTERQAEDLTKQYRSASQLFQIQVKSVDGVLPAYMKDKLASDTQQIFMILSQQLNVSELRQVDLTVKVFNSKSEFYQFSQMIAPGLGSNINGFYSPKENMAAVLKQGRNDDRTFSIARHEAAHVILAGLFGRVPSWFTEGLAEYFEKMEIEGQLKRIQPAAEWLALLRRQVHQGEMMSLSHYLSFNGLSWRAQDTGTMYAMAWLLVFHLMGSDDGRTLLAKYMLKLTENPCQLVDAKLFFEDHYPGGLLALESDMQALLQSDISAHRY